MPLLPLLRGRHVRLTPLSSNDLPVIGRWYHDVEFLRLLDARPAMPQGEESLARWLEDLQKAPDVFHFGIRLLADEALIGYIVLDDLLWAHRSAWLTIAVGDPGRRGKGFGREALDLTLAFAFRELNLHRVQLTVFAYNQAAIHLYERAGFRLEGTFREALERDGRRHDMHLYGILRREWEGAAQGGNPGSG